jgi:hypothetical protein
VLLLLLLVASDMFHCTVVVGGFGDTFTTIPDRDDDLHSWEDDDKHCLIIMLIQLWTFFSSCCFSCQVWYIEILQVKDMPLIIHKPVTAAERRRDYSCCFCCCSVFNSWGLFLCMLAHLLSMRK